MSEEEEIFEVECILGQIETPDGTKYHVRWKGFGPEEDTYEPFENLENCPEILEAYYNKVYEDNRKKNEKESKKKLTKKTKKENKKDPELIEKSKKSKAKKEKPPKEKKPKKLEVKPPSPPPPPPPPLNYESNISDFSFEDSDNSDVIIAKPKPIIIQEDSSNPIQHEIISFQPESPPKQPEKTTEKPKQKETKPKEDIKAKSLEKSSKSSKKSSKTEVVTSKLSRPSATKRPLVEQAQPKEEKSKLKRILSMDDLDLPKKKGTKTPGHKHKTKENSSKTKSIEKPFEKETARKPIKLADPKIPKPVRSVPKLLTEDIGFSINIEIPDFNIDYFPKPETLLNNVIASRARINQNMFERLKIRKILNIRKENQQLQLECEFADIMETSWLPIEIVRLLDSSAVLQFLSNLSFLQV